MSRNGEEFGWIDSKGNRFSLEHLKINPKATRHQEYPTCRACSRKYIKRCLYCKYGKKTHS